MEQYVMTTGTIRMPLLSVHNLDSLLMVSLAFKSELKMYFTAGVSPNELVWFCLILAQLHINLDNSLLYVCLDPS